MRIMLADDHSMFRQGIKALLENDGFDVVAEAKDGHEAVKLAEAHHPEVAVLDMNMPLLNGLHATQEIARISPRTSAVLLTMYEEDAYVLEALRAGVRGYVLKAQAAEDLVQAIREVAKGAIYLSPGISRTVVNAFLSKTVVPDDPLTSRERQVLQLVAEGKTTKEIASLLGVSVKTAESHRGHIMDKLEVHATAGLVRYAIRKGMIQP
ncbi:MAG TPA: response regulator transcription factor [bacterium]